MLNRMFCVMNSDQQILVLKCVLDYLEQVGKTNSHMIVSKQLYPRKVCTLKSDLSMKTLHFHKTLGGFDGLNIAEIAHVNGDERLMEWSRQRWWITPLVASLLSLPLCACLLFIACLALATGLVVLILILLLDVLRLLYLQALSILNPTQL